MTTRQEPDALSSRIHRVAALVRELREENASLREELNEARDELSSLRSTRGDVRKRVQRVLELIAS